MRLTVVQSLSLHLLIFIIGLQILVVIKQLLALFDFMVRLKEVLELFGYFTQTCVLRCFVQLQVTVLQVLVAKVELDFPLLPTVHLYCGGWVSWEWIYLLEIVVYILDKVRSLPSISSSITNLRYLITDRILLRLSLQLLVYYAVHCCPIKVFRRNGQRRHRLIIAWRWLQTELPISLLRAINCRMTFELIAFMVLLEERHLLSLLVNLWGGSFGWAWMIYKFNNFFGGFISSCPWSNRVIPYNTCYRVSLLLFNVLVTRVSFLGQFVNGKGDRSNILMVEWGITVMVGISPIPIQRYLL